MSARSVFLISSAFKASVWMIPMTSWWELMTGKLVKPDLKSLSRMRGPRISLLFTKTISDFDAISSETVRVSKLMMAAIRSRS